MGKESFCPEKKEKYVAETISAESRLNSRGLIFANSGYTNQPYQKFRSAECALLFTSKSLLSLLITFQTTTKNLVCWKLEIAAEDPTA